VAIRFVDLDFDYSRMRRTRLRAYPHRTVFRRTKSMESAVNCVREIT
jgi:hypothetical protein